MAGFSDYLAIGGLNWMLGVQPMPGTATPGIPSNGARFLALYTTAPTGDSGSGGTEVAAASYARVQFAGSITVNGSTTTASPTLHVASVPAWLAALGTASNPGFGVNVWDATTGALIGTVQTATAAATTITLQANAANAVGATDVLLFSAFPAAVASVGTEPSVTPVTATSGAAINFATSGANAFGTVVAYGIYDAVTAGNFMGFDWLGNFKWIPFTASLASPSVFTTDLAADVPTNGSSVVLTSKYGGTLPTGGAFSGILTTAGASGLTFNVGVNATAAGGGQFRQVTQQVVPINNVVSFAAAQLIVTSA
jgi:hypothetical protein